MPITRKISFGTTFSSSGGWLVNKGAGQSAGDTTIAVDGGSGGIAAGTVIRFAGHDSVYLVDTALTGSAGNIVIVGGLDVDVADDTAISILTLTAITDFLDEGWEPGMEEAQMVTYGDGAEEMDGVTVNGQVYALGDDIPAAGTRAWFLYQYGDGYTLYGGPQGCRVSVSASGVRKHGEGPRYECIKYSATGDEENSVIASF